MQYGIRQNLYNDILKIFSEMNVRKVYLFGSRARKEEKFNSDIDLAVIFNDNDKDNFIKLYTKLEELVTLYKFDVIDFNEVKDIKFKNEILNDGIIIYEK